MRISNLFARIEEVLWPRGVICLACSERSRGEYLCPECREALNAARIGDSDGSAQSIWRYEGVAKKLVHTLKFNCVEDAATVLAQEISSHVKRMNLPQDTVFTWVTMPVKRYRERGIDHGRTLCENAAQIAGFSSRQLLVRTRRVKRQLGLSREERIKNLQNAFSCVEDVPQSVLLIDDVMTTGATTAVCVQALKDAGAKQVYVLTATKVI